MKNTMVMGNNEMQAVAMAVMNDVRASGAKVDTLDEMYNVASKYVQVTKDQFEKCLNDLENSYYQNQELSEDQLDMVVGGGVIDWFKDHALTIGIVVAGVLALTGIGIGAGMALGAGWAALTGGVVATNVIMGAATVGTALGGSAAIVGGICIAINAFENGLPD